MKTRLEVYPHVRLLPKAQECTCDVPVLPGQARELSQLPQFSPVPGGFTSTQNRVQNQAKSKVCLHLSALAHSLLWMLNSLKAT